MTPLHAFLLGLVVIPALLFVGRLAYEIPIVVRQAQWERENGVPVYRSCFKPVFWWLLVRPGWKKGSLYE
jgi:hypothetical protein